MLRSKTIQSAPKQVPECSCLEQCWHRIDTTFQVVHAGAFKVAVREQATQEGHMKDGLQEY